MQFLKTYWISLASAAVALAAVVVAALGMTDGSVREQLAQRTAPASEIEQLRRAPQNQATIDAERELGRKNNEQYETVMRKALEINERKPLLDSVFPSPARLELAYRFRSEYADQLAALPRELDAGDVPNEQELADEAEMLAEIAKKRAEQEGTDVASAPEPEPVAPVGGRGGAPPGGFGGRGGPPVGGRGGFMPPAGGRGAPPGGRGGFMPPGGGRGGQVPPVGGSVGGSAAAALSNADLEKARQRAQIKKAKNIRMYAPLTAFHRSPLADATDTPQARDMWYAQVSLWVQQDIVKALRAMNEAAAGDVKEANVTTLPVKHIESVNVLGYVTSTGALVPFPNSQTAAAGGDVTFTPSFTGRKSDDRFNVVRVSVTVIVDKREVLRLVDAVTRSNFYQLVGAEYSTVESLTPEGHIYGAAPVVRAVLQFEGYMARKLFESMMPTEVRQDLGFIAAPNQGENPGA